MTAEPVDPKTEILAEEFRRISSESDRRGLALRLFGSVGFYVHAREPGLYGQLGRDRINDLDFIGRAEERGEYKQLFGDLGYDADQDMLVAGEGRRFLYVLAHDRSIEVDLFIDRLEMCHTIELRDRVSLASGTLPLVDLLLEKLQIVELNRKDMVDVVVLLAEHDLGPGAGAVDAGHAARILGDDWGFYYTATENIGRIREFAAGARLDAAARSAVQRRLDALAREIEAAPKTRRWKLRAKIGTRKKWYQEVEDGLAAF
ncbi:MAG TPA: hypothetical protein VG186_01825 [Solirubrobacteraceae bacterium]|jgi:hypothetical protein|nr:hypothetical protein [Solirubrobacteraceae bacterium]